MTLVADQPRDLSALTTIRANWCVYAIDGALLGAFMVSACGFVALLEHPSSSVHQAINSGFARRALIGIAMGLTALALIYSPWGKRSGAQMNPAITLSFLRIGRLTRLDAVGYISAQFLGAVLGVATMSIALGMLVSHPNVNYAATVPGSTGLLLAWLGEFAITFLLMTVVIAVNKVPRLAPFTGCFAAALVAFYITFEAPISGMSMNPARSFGSALFAHNWTGFWIYCTAPIAGMFSAIELHRAITKQHQRLCGKLSHSRSIACFIPCDCLKGTGT
jgi:aquaporin Z